MTSQSTFDRRPSHNAFVGREPELSGLRAGLDDVSAGHGRLFLLSGEPGIGKTRLAEEISNDAAARGMRVLWGRCWEGGGAPAYWPFIQILRACIDGRDGKHLEALIGSGASEIARLIPEIKLSLPALEEAKAATDSESARFRLFDAVATLLKNVARIQPLFIVIDDLHDADQPSLQMLRFVARETKDARLLIVGTYRDAEVRQSPELGKLIGDLIREGRTVSITGLSLAEVGELIERSSAKKADDKLVADLYHATDGNPLFVDGVVRLLAAEGKLERRGIDGSAFKIPDGVRESIRRRLAALSDQANSLLSIASVIGNEFDSRLLELVSDHSLALIVAQTDEAVRIGILKGEAAGSATHQFSHALIRDVLYEELSANRRIELHCAIGSAIEEIHKGDPAPYLAELAHHYIRALPRVEVEKAIDYSIRAGKAAYALFAYEEVIHHWEAAAALQKERGADPNERARLLEDLGAPALLGLEERGVGYLEQALKLYEGLGQDEAAARVHLKMGYSLIDLINPVLRSYPLALSHYRSAETLLRASQNLRLRGALYSGLSDVAWELMQGEQGFEASRRALEIGLRSGNELLWVRGAVAHANSLYNAGDLAEAFQLLNQAWEKADELNGTSAAAVAAASAGYCHAFLWNPPETEEWARRELSKSRLQHAPSLRRHLFHNLSHAYVLAGKLKETKQLLINSPCLLVEANVAFYAGDWSQAESTLLRDLEEQGRRAGRPKQEAFAMVWLARLHHARSEYSKAENLLRRALAIVQGQYLHIEIDIRSELTILYVDSARANEAPPELAQLRGIINKGEDWRGLAGHVAVAEASVAVAEGRFQEAQGHFEAAVEIARRFQVPWDEAAALHRWGRALVTAGEHHRAVEKFDVAIDTYRRHGGGQRWIDRVMVDKMRSAEPLPETSGEHRGSAEDSIFHREGDYWTVAYEGRTTRLKDAKGLHYIAYLLAHPGEEIRALDLVARIGGGGEEIAEKVSAQDLSRSDTVTGDLGHAGEILDAQAKAAYQRRLTELEDEIEEAREFKDAERIAKAEDEKEALGRELRGAIGLAGRDRRSASAAERGRIAVTKAIRLSLNKIAENDASLGKLLSTTIKTGTVCAYVPDGRFPVSWRL